MPIPAGRLILHLTPCEHILCRFLKLRSVVFIMKITRKGQSCIICLQMQ
jgi:hypothetical protein